MERKKGFFSVWSPPPHLLVGGGGRNEELASIEFEMAAVLAQALEARTTTPQILEHSRRVAKVATALGEMVSLRADEAERLHRAAQLHEIGMVGVPAGLLLRPNRLTPGELEQVRAHARMGAEIVRATHDLPTARLIERQYADYEDVARLTCDSRELLLSGLLRVADVYDAMTTPRPYQESLPGDQWRQVLQVGSGSKFHPAAVFALLHWANGGSEQ